MITSLQSLLDEPRAPSATGGGRRDRLLVVGVAAAATLEAALGDHMSLPWLSWLVTVGLSPTMFWRRSHPLAVVALAFGVAIVVDVGLLVADAPALEMVSATWFLLLPYALFRWGSGREAGAGLVIILVAAVLGLVIGWTGVGDAIGGTAVLLSSIAVGIAVRAQHGARGTAGWSRPRRTSGSRSRESCTTPSRTPSPPSPSRRRPGRALAATDPAASVQALDMIEQEASRTLAEMRAMVRVLRNQSAADCAPQPGVKDLDGLPTAVDAAVYRIVQEGVTNALRHARNATAVDVHVEADGSRVTLTVHDDGEPTTAPGAGPGFGITGMVERAKLLGGECQVGPGTQRGWAVEATLPLAVTR